MDNTLSRGHRRTPSNAIVYTTLWQVTAWYHTTLDSLLHNIMTDAECSLLIITEKYQDEGQRLHLLHTQLSEPAADLHRDSPYNIRRPVPANDDPSDDNYCQFITPSQAQFVPQLVPGPQHEVGHITLCGARCCRIFQPIINMRSYAPILLFSPLTTHTHTHTVPLFTPHFVVG